MQTPVIRQLVLGSSSVYRQELLARLRIPFIVYPPDVNETPHPQESCVDLACRLAWTKAQAVANQYPDAVVIGSDQVADLNGQALGKPGNHDRAVVQLRQMSDRVVLFQTAVAVVCKASGFDQVELATVRVKFRALSEQEIEAYLRMEQPYDCAGSAKSEGLGIALLQSIDSDDPTALIGLPLIRTCRMLATAGIVLFAQPSQ
jgi:septum formation protein